MIKIEKLPPSKLTKDQAMSLPDIEKPIWLKRGVCHCGKTGDLYLMEVYSQPKSSVEQTFVYVCGKCEQKYFNTEQKHDAKSICCSVGCDDLDTHNTIFSGGNSQFLSY